MKHTHRPILILPHCNHSEPAGLCSLHPTCHVYSFTCRWNGESDEYSVGYVIGVQRSLFWSHTCGVDLKIPLRQEMRRKFNWRKAKKKKGKNIFVYLFITTCSSCSLHLQHLRLTSAYVADMLHPYTPSRSLTPASQLLLIMFQSKPYVSLHQNSGLI